METVVQFLVFFVVFGPLWYLASERRRRSAAGNVQPRSRALIRSAATAAVAGVIFVLLFRTLSSM